MVEHACQDKMMKEDMMKRSYGQIFDADICLIESWIPPPCPANDTCNDTTNWVLDDVLDCA